jgi:hypothetical protein
MSTLPLMTKNKGFSNIRGEVKQVNTLEIDRNIRVKS